MSDEEIPGQLQFPDHRVHAHCYCLMCEWQIYPTGWYFTDGRFPSKADVAGIWQDAHNDAGQCLNEIIIIGDDEELA